MLAETALKNLKPKDAVYKVADRDGMYLRSRTRLSLPIGLLPGLQLRRSN